MSDKLAGVRLKIERAKKHVADLDALVRAFGDSRPYKLRPHYDPQTRSFSYAVESIEPVPAEIPLVAGDAIHCLRSALDQLAFQLFLGNHPAADPAIDGRNVYFPIAENSAAYFRRPNDPKSSRGRVIHAFSQAAVQAIDAIEPYGGGKGEPLWVLHQLDVTDKHRLLIAAVAGCMGPDPWHMDEILPPGTEYRLYFSMDPAPMEIGKVVLWLPPDVEPKENPKARGGVAIGETRIFDREAIAPALGQLTQFVDHVVDQLARLL